MRPAEAATDKYHGVNAFDVVTGKQSKPKANAPAYTKVFADALVQEAARDPKIVADHRRHAVAAPASTRSARPIPTAPSTSASPSSTPSPSRRVWRPKGYKPFCAIYSTFLQRGYDQLVHDVALQNLPVRFAIDRAGLVGADGATHAGAFDLAYLCLPAQHGGDGGGGRSRTQAHGRDLRRP